MNRSRERLILVAGLAATLAVLFGAARGAPLGVPAADDYLFLFRQRFGPFDLLDSAGAAWYWRPVSRQLYFALVGPWLPGHPAVAVSLHLALLVATALGLWSFARRHLPPAAALAAALFPLLVEPARVLLAWPSAAQHLLPMAGVAVALGAAASGRLALALAGAALALGSIESAVLVLPLLPLAAARDRGPAVRTWVTASAVLGAAWLALRMLAAARGVVVPAGLTQWSMGAVLDTLRLATVAQLGLEDLPPAIVMALAVGYAVALGGALLPRDRRAGVAGGGPPSAGTTPIALAGLAWWFAGVVPLAGIQPNWNAWRSCLPGLGLGLACAVVLARGRAWTVALFLAVRALALVLAAPASPAITVEPPPSASHLSFTRLARLQFTAERTRAALLAPPAIERGAQVRYWNFPLLAEFGFGGATAARVWLADSTVRFGPFRESEGIRDTAAVVVAFDLEGAGRAVRIRREVQRALFRADAAMGAGRPREADDLLAAALALQPEGGQRLRAVVNGNRVWLLIELGHHSRADSLHRLSEGDVPAPDWLRAEVWLGLGAGDTLRATRAVERLLAANPGDAEMRRVAAAIGMR